MPTEQQWWDRKSYFARKIRERHNNTIQTHSLFFHLYSCFFCKLKGEKMDFSHTAQLFLFFSILHFFLSWQWMNVVFIHHLCWVSKFFHVVSRPIKFQSRDIFCKKSWRTSEKRVPWVDSAGIHGLFSGLLHWCTKKRKGLWQNWITFVC